ncbi:hypothetical protein BDV37DRAFT_268992 [Aspergillus pseudonomiae]|uniref:Aminoglycoside phosphotransferase domain-containing protein n=1 Tax=Aspergillus pseudonomiae TaxID=1506151 RepID=A0A5N7DN18_9EURO|nr:uncharacterized protein BDV37DRAFT_268992 [Aspergillus pseudonomiae]KAE8407861.1 hypothetical protein BDV37DRAFT_268992 [Aspergillus pseudonomiae]
MTASLPLFRGNSISLEDALEDNDNILHRLDYPQKNSYNVCIPVYIDPLSEEVVLIRIPLPFKIGEAFNPGNMDEKLRCEVATYIWIRENCLTVPIPSLYGFAFPNRLTVCELNPISFSLLY